MSDVNCSYGCTDDVAAKCCPTHGTKAHAMSQPNMHSDGEPMQHVSNAAWEARLNMYPNSNRPVAETWYVREGTVLRTVKEWQALEQYASEAQTHAIDCGNRAIKLYAQLAIKDSVIADLQRQLRERDDGRNSVVAVRDTDSGHSLDRSNTRRSERVGRLDAVTATLTLLPESDARLGRGNAAMDAGE